MEKIFRSIPHIRIPHHFQLTSFIWLCSWRIKLYRTYTHTYFCKQASRYKVLNNVNEKSRGTKKRTKILKIKNKITKPNKVKNNKVPKEVFEQESSQSTCTSSYTSIYALFLLSLHTHTHTLPTSVCLFVLVIDVPLHTHLWLSLLINSLLFSETFDTIPSSYSGYFFSAKFSLYPSIHTLGCVFSMSICDYRLGCKFIHFCGVTFKIH